MQVDLQMVGNLFLQSYKIRASTRLERGSASDGKSIALHHFSGRAVWPATVGIAQGADKSGKIHIVEPVEYERKKRIEYAVVCTAHDPARACVLQGCDCSRPHMG